MRVKSSHHMCLDKESKMLSPDTTKLEINFMCLQAILMSIAVFHEISAVQTGRCQMYTHATIA